jgi:hypothetical protein
LRAGPWTVSHLHRSTLGLHKTPWKFRGLCNVVLGLWGRRGLEEFWRPRPGSAWEGSRGCGEPTWALVWGDDDRRRAARRRPAAGAAGAWALASLGLGQGNARVGKLREVLVEAQAVRVGDYATGGWSFAWPPMVATAALQGHPAREERAASF